MQNKLVQLNKVFKEDANINISWKQLKDGDKKPVVKYKTKGFISPSKMLNYKAKQIYNTDNITIEKFKMAVDRANDYHKLFEFINQGYTPKILQHKQQQFTNAVKTFYKEYKLTPITGEYILWNEKDYTMCICDGLAVDKDGNWVVIELKTMEVFDLKKQLMSHFQTHIAKKILETKLNVSNTKAYTIRWSHNKEELIVKENQLQLNNLQKHFQTILDTEQVWNEEIEKLKKINTNKDKKNDLLEKLKEREK